MRMLVLAGGFGSRLQSVVSDVPKPLAPVGGEPFLRHQMDHWVEQGVRSFVFLLHHKADLIERFLEQHAGKLSAECEIRTVIEPTPLDTGGAVAHAVRRLDLRGDFLITNADTWLGAGVRELMSAGADAMLVVAQPDISRYGQVEFDGAGHVTAFREKREGGGAGWINGGMCLLNAEHFRTWNGERLSLEKAVFPRLLAERRLKAVPLETEFIDIGVPEDYQLFRRRWDDGRGDGSCSWTDS